MSEMVNFVLQCTGCKARVTSHDIEDIDNVTNKLGDLQSEYQESPIVDYPLVSRQKEYGAFRAVLVDFFRALIRTVHHSSTLYEDTALFENIQTWVDTMSSAAIRPFRHTATVISLTVSTALCEIARDLEVAISMSRRQAEAESKKKKANQARVKSMHEKIDADEDKLTAVESILKDEFDVVFVHRYRDVDPKIRVECVAAIGTWILTYRKMFLEGQYLRYLGWVLSDTVAQTRAEVVRQLKLLFKNPANIGPLRGFTDRFRPRMVEIAARDAEPAIRADTVELLDKLREAELLEPNDIDIIGQLIFDLEPRMRKAVGKFFVSNLEDLFKVRVEAVGQEQLDENLEAEPDGENHLRPNQSWIKFKCLAESLVAYDSGEQEHSREGAANLLLATNTDSRYMLATQAIFPHLAELRQWESLAGYLLYDHSGITSTVEDIDSAAAVQGLYRLEEGEEGILLEVLDYAVKLYLVQTAEVTSDGKNKKKARRNQASKDHTQELQENAARHLTLIIPQLLNKYGSVPAAASVIFRLHQLLDVDLLDELQTVESTYGALLENVDKQFMTHSDPTVLAEASAALLKVRSSEPAREVTDNKVQEMWDEMLSRLQTVYGKQTPEGPGTLSGSILTEISNIVSRLSNLASISDCTLNLENSITTLTPQQGRRKPTETIQSASLLEILLRLCRHGKLDDELALDEDVAFMENRLTTSAMKTLLFYFMWKIRSLRSSISARSTVRHLETNNAGFLTDLANRRDNFAAVLSEVAASRSALDPLRLSALSTVMDLFTLFSTVRNPSTVGGKSQQAESNDLLPIVREQMDTHIIATMPRLIQTSIMHSHDRLERFFAKKSRRKLLPSPNISNDNDDRGNGDGGEQRKRDNNTTTAARAARHHKEPAENDLPIDSDSDESDDHENRGDDGTFRATKNKKLSNNDIEQEDDDLEDDDDDDDDDTGDGLEDLLGSDRDARRAVVLLAEQTLCEFTGKIVLAVLAEVMGTDSADEGKKRQQTKLEERLSRNKTRLGNNYKEVLAYLQQGQLGERKSGRKVTEKKARGSRDAKDVQHKQGRRNEKRTAAVGSGGGGGGGGVVVVGDGDGDGDGDGVGAQSTKNRDSRRQQKSPSIILSEDEDEDEDEEEIVGQEEEEAAAAIDDADADADADAEANADEGGDDSDEIMGD